MKRHNGFSRSRFTGKGQSTYVCQTCARRTRYTGAQSLGSDLCPQCYELAGIGNEISDGHRTREELQPQINDLIAEIREKGGNPDESFADLIGGAQ